MIIGSGGLVPAVTRGAFVVLEVRMTLTAIDRIHTAVELNPDRSRVTIRRDDARAAVAEVARFSDQAETHRACAARAESMLTEHCETIERLTRERDGFKALAGRRRRSAEYLVDPLSFMPAAWWLYGLSAFAGVLVGRG